MERLDRGVANYEWLTCFPIGRVRHLNCFTSDHRLILLYLDDNGEQQKWRRNPFGLNLCGFQILNVKR